jgi:hypothetical protein
MAGEPLPNAATAAELMPFSPPFLCDLKARQLSNLVEEGEKQKDNTNNGQNE